MAAQFKDQNTMTPITEKLVFSLFRANFNIFISQWPSGRASETPN